MRAVRGIATRAVGVAVGIGMSMGSCSVAVAGAAAPSLAPSGSAVADAPIQPGAAMCAVDDVVSRVAALPACDVQGTLSYVFRGAGGALFIGTAAHNVPDGTVDVFVPPCAACRGLDGQPFGRVVFQSDSVDVGHPDDLAERDLLDFALIEVRRSWHHLVEPRVRHWGGPVGVVLAPEASTGDAAVAYGNGAPAGPRAPGQVVAASQTAFSTTVAEVGGDSGMPYLHASSGKALGVNGNCPCGAAGYYPTVQHVLDRLAAHGFDLTLVTGPPAPPLAALMGDA